MKLSLFIIVLLIVSINSNSQECRVDSDCSRALLCVDRECLHSNHRSGGVVITDRNIEDQCSPDCPTDQKCVSGACVPEI